MMQLLGPAPTNQKIRFEAGDVDANRASTSSRLSLRKSGKSGAPNELEGMADKDGGVQFSDVLDFTVLSTGAFPDNR